MSDKVQDLVHHKLLGVDAKTTGATTIFTTDVGRRFRPLLTSFEMTAANTITVGATVSVGITASAYSDIISASVVGTTANKMLPFPPATLIDSIAGGTDVKVNVSVAATGVSGTFRVDIFGYYD